MKTKSVDNGDRLYLDSQQPCHKLPFTNEEAEVRVTCPMTYRQGGTVLQLGSLNS